MLKEPKEAAMTNRPRSTPSERTGASPSKPRGGASRAMPSSGRVNIVEMVRSLQRTEGVTDCFRAGKVDCDDIQCNWRAYCLDKAPKFACPEKENPRK
jgi:hypothetical protein